MPKRRGRPTIGSTRCTTRCTAATFWSGPTRAVVPRYTIGRCYSPRTGEAYFGPRPSRKSIERFCREISEMTERRWASRQVDYQVAEINRKLKGWANYFRLGTVQRAHRLVDNHVRYRLRRWLKAKYKVRGPGKTRFPKGYLYEDLGLHSLLGWAGRSPSAKG